MLEGGRQYHGGDTGRRIGTKARATVTLTSTGLGTSTPGVALKSGQKKVPTVASPRARLRLRSLDCRLHINLDREGQPTVCQGSYPGAHQEPPLAAPRPALLAPPHLAPLCSSCLAHQARQGQFQSRGIFPAGRAAPQSPPPQAHPSGVGCHKPRQGLGP